MAVTVKRITLWRSEVENKAGMLAQTLRPLADAGASLQVVMAYRFPGEPTGGAIELFPVSGKKSQVAAQTAGLDRSSIPTILVMGDDRPGLGSQIAEAIAGSGINVEGLRYGEFGVHAASFGWAHVPSVCRRVKEMKPRGSRF